MAHHGAKQDGQLLADEAAASDDHNVHVESLIAFLRLRGGRSFDGLLDNGRLHADGHAVPAVDQGNRPAQLDDLLIAGRPLPDEQPVTLFQKMC
jgi:hypothetical protein